MKFTEFCEQNGIKLLREDMKFLRKHLDRIPLKLHKRVLSDYSKEWISELKFNENSSQSTNLARRRANLALTDIIETIIGKK